VARPRSNLAASRAPRFRRRPAAALGLLAAAALLWGTGPLAHAQEPPPPSVLPGAPEAAGPAPETLPPAGPQVEALSAILVDGETGAVLWERDAHSRRPNASTTKIMTAMLMIESGRLHEAVTFSERARRTDYANLNARPGERFSMRDLLYAVLLRSSNDSCVAVGEHLAGSPWKFAWQMTERARALGARNTNFVTTNGLYHPQHYSSAADLALMARQAFRYPEFAEAVRTQQHLIERTLNTKDRLLKNHNKFLVRYPGADGVKTGYVRQSGRCLVASATSVEAGNPWRLVAVVLNSPDTYGDCARMIDWGRAAFQPVFAARPGEPLARIAVRGAPGEGVPATPAAPLVAVVPRGTAHRVRVAIEPDPAVTAPVRPGDTLGAAVLYLDERPAARVPLAAAEAALAPTAPHGAALTGSSLLLLLLLGSRYARTSGKSPRRRRHRFAARRRAADRRG
jgi:D-alanyl-D-alanine carboxypeptidase (penicillin-binding protein 5/6)